MIIDGKTKVCGLIGKPVEHTMSPLIHNTLAEKIGLPLVYVPFLVEEDVITAVQGAWQLNVLGMNITVPYKSDVMAALTECDELAAKIGAVNTLVRTKQGYKGYNTDISGLYRAISSEGIRIENQKVILLGAGGAARAVAYLLASYGAGKVFLMNRSLDKAEKIAAEVNQAFEKELIVPMTLTDYSGLPREKMLCIQATSVGLAPDVDKTVIEDREFYQWVHTGYDLIYRPAKTRFVQLVEENGGVAFHGLKMLLYQAVEAFELWNGVKVEEELALEIYEKMKGEMGIEE